MYQYVPGGKEADDVCIFLARLLVPAVRPACVAAVTKSTNSLQYENTGKKFFAFILSTALLSCFVVMR
jgi:hypothetical protein